MTTLRAGDRGWRALGSAAVLSIWIAVSAGPASAASASSVTLLDGVALTDAARDQAVYGTAPIGKGRRVTLFGHLVDLNPLLVTGAYVRCWFVLGEDAGPFAAPSVIAIVGRLTTSGFTYESSQPGAAIAGDRLVCEARCTGADCGSTVTLKAVFTR